MVDVPARAAVALENAVPQARELAEALEAAGWTPKVATDQKIRYWCPGPDCRHQTWIDMNPKSLTYFASTRQHLHSMTCWKEETND